MYSLPGDLVPPDSQDRPQMLVLLKSASVGKRKRKAVPREAPQAIPEDVLGPPLVRAFTVGLPCGLFCLNTHALCIHLAAFLTKLLLLGCHVAAVSTCQKIGT